MPSLVFSSLMSLKVLIEVHIGSGEFAVVGDGLQLLAEPPQR
jgi:hypothetical protein